jgi:hypothetical protein
MRPDAYLIARPAGGCTRRRVDELAEGAERAHDRAVVAHRPRVGISQVNGTALRGTLG